MLKWTVLLGILLLFCSALRAQVPATALNKELMRYVVTLDGLDGLVDERGSVLVEPEKGQKLRFFSNDRCMFSKKEGGKKGYWDAAGTVVVKPQYRTASPFVNGLAVVVQKKETALLDLSGSVVLSGPYKEALPLSGNLIAASKDGELWGIFGRDGSNVLAPEYNAIWGLYKGLVHFQKGAFTGLMLPNGMVLLEPKTYSYISAFNLMGQALAKTSTNTAGMKAFDVIDLRGQRVYALIGERVVTDLANSEVLAQQGDKWFLYNHKGQQVFETNYELLDHFGEGLCPVKVEGKVGYMNRKQELIIPPQFEHGLRFRQGLAIVTMNGKQGLINHQGEFVLPAVYDAIRPSYAELDVWF